MTQRSIISSMFALSIYRMEERRQMFTQSLQRCDVSLTTIFNYFTPQLFYTGLFNARLACNFSAAEGRASARVRYLSVGKVLGSYYWHY